MIENEQIEIKLHFDIVLKHKIAKNQTLSKQEYDSLIYDNDLLFAKNAAYHYATYKKRTEKEVIVKLKSKDYDDSIIESCIEFLKEFKLLNDFEYAKLFTSEKSYAKSWGKFRIKNELLKKGIKINIIEDALFSSFPEEENFRIAVESARKKYKQIKYKNDPVKIQNSIISYLQRNGFNFDTIKQVIEELKI